MFNGCWRTKSTSLVPMSFEREKIYLLMTRTVGLKRHFGGRHTYIYWYSNTTNRWLTVEVSDHETLQIQKAEIVMAFTNEFLEMRPFISNRAANQQWFGSKPVILDSIVLKVNDEDIFEFVHNYPVENYHLLYNNCNTFTSYLNFQLKKNYGVQFQFCKILFGYVPSFYWSIKDSIALTQKRISKFINQSDSL